MRENRVSFVVSTLLSILILIVIAGAAYYIVQSIQNTTDRALAPFEQANSGLRAQVAEVLHPTPTVIPDLYLHHEVLPGAWETIQYSMRK
jgi:hypothetical protein